MPCVCGLHWLPILCATLLPLTFIISYAIAVGLGHVEPGFPYISDTGTYSPESCVFGQLLNISALVVGATIYVRYKQVEEYNRHNARLLRTNKAGLVLGLLAAFGISLVANFQELNVLIVHLIGALLAFGIGAVYCWVQTYMSYRMIPHVNESAVCHLRLVLCIFISVTFILIVSCGAVSFLLLHQHGGNKFKPGQPGFVEHIVSTASEWAMSLFMLAYFLTYVKEFKQIKLSTPEIHQIINDRDPLVRESGTFDSPDEVIT